VRDCVRSPEIHGILAVSCLAEAELQAMKENARPGVPGSPRSDRKPLAGKSKQPACEKRGLAVSLARLRV
jgi:hypothetical protein